MIILYHECQYKYIYMFDVLVLGRIIQSNEDIIAENVPIVTPNGDTIVDSLSLKVDMLT
jgi:hypothetical protein